MIFRLIHYILISLLLFSCSDTLSLLSENEPFRIESLDQGAFVSEKELLPVKINTYNSSSVSLNLVAELYDSQNNLLESITIENVDTNETVYFEELFHGLKNGVYTVNFSIFEEGESVYITTIPVFLQNEAIEEISLFSYSQEVYPVSYTIIQMESNISDEEDPYVIWISENETLKEGYYSEGLSELIWKSPVENGIYEISAYFYPEKPLNDTFSISPFSASLNIFVSDQISLSKHELDNSDSGYRSLYHFRGNVRDEVSDSDTYWSGEFLPTLSKNIPGIIVLNDSLVLEKPLIPLNNGDIIPFSIALNFTPGNYLNESSLFSTALQGARGLGIELKRTGQYLYRFTLISGNEENVIDFTMELSGNAYEELLFSYIPGDDISEFSLFLNGKSIDKVEVLYLNGPFIQGESKLGSFGDHSVFHELGVYSKEGIYGFSILSPDNEEIPEYLFYDNFETMNGDKYFLSDDSLKFHSGYVSLPPRSHLILELPDFSGVDSFNISILSDSPESVYINETRLHAEDNIFIISVYDTVFRNIEGIDILRNATNYLSIRNEGENETIIYEMKISQ